MLYSPPMPRNIAARSIPILLIALLLTPTAVQLGAQKLEPLVYTLSFPNPASKTFDVSVTVPTGKRESVDLMMAIWSPGFYGIQNYARNVSAFAAKAPDGTVLEVMKPNDSRW